MKKNFLILLFVQICSTIFAQEQKQLYGKAINKLKI